jgi:hypothetical protein
VVSPPRLCPRQGPHRRKIRKNSMVLARVRLA